MYERLREFKLENLPKVGEGTELKRKLVNFLLDLQEELERVNHSLHLEVQTTTYIKAVGFTIFNEKYEECIETGTIYYEGDFQMQESYEYLLALIKEVEYLGKEIH